MESNKSIFKTNLLNSILFFGILIVNTFNSQESNAKNKENIDLKQLEEYCRENLSSYKIPKEFHFVESLPRNASGKILKRVIKEEVDNNQLKVL